MFSLTKVFKLLCLSLRTFQYKLPDLQQCCGLGAPASCSGAKLQHPNLKMLTCVLAVKFLICGFWVFAQPSCKTNFLVSLQREWKQDINVDAAPGPSLANVSSMSVMLGSLIGFFFMCASVCPCSLLCCMVLTVMRCISCDQEKQTFLSSNRQSSERNSERW